MFPKILFSLLLSQTNQHTTVHQQGATELFANHKNRNNPKQEDELCAMLGLE